MEIKGTAFEIIADVNGLKHVKGRVYECPKGDRFYLNKLGFTHVEIYNAESVKFVLSDEIEKLKKQNNNLKIELDDLDFRYVTLKNSIESKIKKAKEKILAHCDVRVHQANRREVLQKKRFAFAHDLILKVRSSIFHNDMIIDNILVDLDSFCQAMIDIKSQHTNENKELFSSKKNR